MNNRQQHDEKQMMKEEYGRELSGCLRAVIIVALFFFAICLYLMF